MAVMMVGWDALQDDKMEIRNSEWNFVFYDCLTAYMSYRTSAKLENSINVGVL